MSSLILGPLSHNYSYGYCSLKNILTILCFFINEVGVFYILFYDMQCFSRVWISSSNECQLDILHYKGNLLQLQVRTLSSQMAQKHFVQFGE